MPNTSDHEESGVHDAVRSTEIELEELRRDHVRLKKRGRRTLVAAGLLFVLAISLFISVWHVTTRISRASPSVKPYYARKIGKYVAVGLASVPWYFGSRLAFQARRCFKKNARLALLEDARTPVLYLRSFVHDETQSSGFGLKWTRYRAMPVMRFNRVRSEESLVRELSRCVGPVIAIGRPGEPLPELGAYRFYVAEESWKAEIVRQMRNSRLVVLRTGKTAGVLWELAQLLENVSADRIALYCPHQTMPRPVRELVANRLGVRLGACRFAAFDSSGNPSQFDTIEEVLRFHGVYIQKGPIACVVDMVQDGEFRYRLFAIFLLAVVGALLSYMIVSIFDPKQPQLVFWSSYVFCLILSVITSFSLPVRRMPIKKVTLKPKQSSVRRTSSARPDGRA